MSKPYGRSISPLESKNQASEGLSWKTIPVMQHRPISSEGWLWRAMYTLNLHHCITANTAGVGSWGPSLPLCLCA